MTNEVWKERDLSYLVYVWYHGTLPIYVGMTKHRSRAYRKEHTPHHVEIWESQLSKQTALTVEQTLIRAFESRNVKLINQVHQVTGREYSMRRSRIARSKAQGNSH